MATAAKQQSTTTTGVRAASSTTSSSSSLGKKINTSTKTITNSTTILTSGGGIGRSSSPIITGSKQRLSPTGTSTAAAAAAAAAAFIETEDDIATIAKQISDHAEAIYQTWKARGLAPTEILNCHTGNSVDAFGKALTPPNRNSLEADFLAQSPDMSNNNLEKLVSSFVNEDKARQQAAKKQTTTTTGTIGSSNILTSGTIKDALRKFESNSTPSGYVKPNYLIKNTSTSSSTAVATSKQSSSYSKTKAASTTLNNTSSISNKNSNSSNNINSSTGSNIISNSGGVRDIGVSQVSSTRNATTKLTTTPKTTPSAPLSPSNISSLSKSVPDVLIDTINQAKPQLSPKINVTRSSTIQQQQQQQHQQQHQQQPSVTSVSSPSSVSSNRDNISNSSSINSTTTTSNNSNNINTSTTSTIFKKPQTPAKPASLLNHTPSWPLKNRLGLGGNTAGNTTISNSSGSVTSSSSSSTIKNDLKSRDVSPSSGGGGGSKLITAKTIEVGKKSADLLDEVSREEERLINALKTGVVLNNNDKLPEVITSTLTKNDKIDRSASSWTKPDISTTSSNILSSVKSTSTVAAKSAAAVSSATTVVPQVISSRTATNTIISTSPTSITTTTLSSPAASNKIRTWSDDPIKAVITSTATLKSSSLVSSAAVASTTVTPSSTIKSTTPAPGMTTTSSPAAGVVTTTASQNLQKTTEIMSPAPTPNKIRLRPKGDAAVPHPDTKNSNSHNNYVNSRINVVNPVRPFLTRGSVAERVLMFEKCPDVKVPLRNINRDSTKVMTKPLVKPEQQTHTTLQRHIRSSSKNVYIPRFHYPHGKPLPTIAMETTLQRIVSAFDSFPNNQVTKEDLPLILKICGLPFYWRMPIIAVTQVASSGLIDGYRFVEFWKQMSVYCHDVASRFVYILSRGQRSRPYILHEDLAPLVQDVVDTHPGLAFLKEATEFHSRYVHTVIARIFYSVNRSWSGKITVPELRRSNLLQVIQLLEEEEDINQIMAFFSYEHFYVIYCKFWELDRDHDLFIDQNDLARHNDHALSTRIIERIFSGCVTRGTKTTRVSGPNGPKMSYTDFVWFLLSEEDKTNPTAIEYWFRCMDLDGDGILSMYELEYFYEEQQQRMEAIGIETLPFEDCLCQMLDMVKPVKPGCISLGDLKRCRMTPIFFDTFFNLEKYLEHEQRDPFATQRDSEDGLTDWDRYAAQEYELLVAEEGELTQGSYDEDDEYESNIDILESQLDDMSNMLNEW